MARPLQVYLEDSELDALRAWAESQGWTLSQAVRAALRALTRTTTSSDPLLTASGMIDALPPELSQRFDEYLDLTYVAARAGHAHPKRAPKKAVRR